MTLAVDRVMTEGSLYDPELAALAIKQAQGDLIEAIFLLRAYRTTLPRLAVSEPVDTAAMDTRRRISATFKDVPGGQVLGPTFDYTHRLLDFALAAEGETQAFNSPPAPQRDAGPMPRVSELLDRDGLIEPAEPDDGTTPVRDLTQEPLRFPAGRDHLMRVAGRGQNVSRSAN